MARWRILPGRTIEGNPQLCVDCGYCLFGLERSQGARCPECGREMPRTPEEFERQSNRRPLPVWVRAGCWLQVATFFAAVCLLGLPGVLDFPDRAAAHRFANSLVDLLNYLGLLEIFCSAALVGGSRDLGRCAWPYAFGAAGICMALLPKLSTA